VSTPSKGTVQSALAPGADYPATAAGFKFVGETTRIMNRRNTQEVHYSDGLDFISLFEQKRIKSNRPTIVPKAATPISINNKSAHLIRRASLETLIWDSGALRLTVVGEANHNRMLAFAAAIDQFVSNSKLK
jgi:anti-sigma factor RsiW